jgi:hypothetical protein
MSTLIQSLLTNLKITGRCGSGTVKAIVLHQFLGGYDELVGKHNGCDELPCPAPCTSYHYGVDSASGRATKFVNHADQSITYVDPVNLPATSIALAGEAVGTSANCTTINVAIAVPTARANNKRCKCPLDPDSKAYKRFVKVLAEMIAGDPTLNVNLLIAAGDPATNACPNGSRLDTCNQPLKCLDITKLKVDVAAELAAVPPPPLTTPGCQALGLVGQVLSLTGGGCAPSTVTLPAAGPTTNVLAFDTPTGLLTSTVNGVAATTTITVPPSHPAAALTNNAAPFAWDTATQTGNIPAVTATVNPAGTVLTTTIGGVVTTFNPFAAIRTCNGVALNPSSDLIPTCDQMETAILAAQHPQIIPTFTAGAGNTWNPATGELNIEPNGPATVVNDDQALSSTDGSITFTPSAPTGPDSQVNYDLGINPTWLCAQIGSKPQAATQTLATELLASTCETVSIADILALDTTLCTKLNALPVVALDPALPIQLLQKSAAGVCQIAEIAPTESCVDPLQDFALTKAGFRRVRAGYSVIAPAASVSTDNGTHLFVTTGGFTVANPTATAACNAEINITNVDPAGGDTTFSVTSLNGTTQVLTLRGFNGPGWLTAFGENNQGESLTLFWDAAAGTYRLTE